MECFEKKFNANTNNNSIRIIGSLRGTMDYSLSGSPSNTNKFIVKWRTASSNHTIKIITPGVKLYDDTGINELELPYILDTNIQTTFCVKEPCIVEVSDKYAIQNFYSAGGMSVDLGEFKYCKYVANVYAASYTTNSDNKGNIEDLENCTELTMINLNGKGYFEGDVLNLIKKQINIGRHSCDGLTLRCPTNNGVTLNYGSLPSANLLLVWEETNINTCTLYVKDRNNPTTVYNTYNIVF